MIFRKINIFLVLSVLISCKEDTRRQGIINAHINTKVEEATVKKIAECKRQALDIAIKNADSILIQNAELWQISSDNIPRPPKPGKPSDIKIKAIVDSSPVVPIFPIKKK